MSPQRTKIEKSSGNVFLDIGFDEIKAEELAVKSDLVASLTKAIRIRRLTQAKAARLCATDQPTLSKILSGSLGSVTIDRLARWIVLLGGKVEITVSPPRTGAKSKRGELSIQAR